MLRLPCDWLYFSRLIREVKHRLKNNLYEEELLIMNTHIYSAYRSNKRDNYRTNNIATLLHVEVKAIHSNTLFFWSTDTNIAALSFA